MVLAADRQIGRMGTQEARGHRPSCAHDSLRGTGLPVAGAPSGHCSDPTPLHGCQGSVRGLFSATTQPCTHCGPTDCTVSTASLAAPCWKRTFVTLHYGDQRAPSCPHPAWHPPCDSKKGLRVPPQNLKAKSQGEAAGASFPGPGPAHITEGALACGGARWRPAWGAEVRICV